MHVYVRAYVRVCAKNYFISHSECILKQMVEMYIKAVHAVGACATIKLV